MPKTPRVQWLHSARNLQEMEDRYNRWAPEYDDDLENGYSYIGAQTAGALLTRHVPKGARILDAGAGTGLVGRYLAELGYTDLMAMDMSPAMLDESRKKNLYRELHQMVMGEPLDFPSDAFDAVISVGVFTTGHAPASSFDELLRVTVPGGHLVFSIRLDGFETGGFDQKLASLEAEGKWELVEVTNRFAPMPDGEPDIFYRVWAYRVN